MWKYPTEYDLAAIQNAYEFVAGCLIMVHLEQFCNAPSKP